MRSRAGFLVAVLIVAVLLGGVTATSVAAATKTTVTWKVSSLTAGQVKSLSAVATSNSPGVKTWSKTGSCVLSTKSNPPKLTMGTGGSCTLTLKIAKTGHYTAKTSTKTLTQLTTSTTVPTTTTTSTTVPTTTTSTTVPTTTTTSTTVPTTTTTSTTVPTTTTTTVPTTTTTTVPTTTTSTTTTTTVPTTTTTSTTVPTTTTSTTTTTTTTTTTVAPTTTTTTVVLTCATGGSCAVGDAGPGGGVIFFVDLGRAVGSQYFEAACAGWYNSSYLLGWVQCDGTTADPGAQKWACTSVTDADGTAIGTGELNTTKIVSDCPTSSGMAASLCDNLVLGGQSDWFLPSKDELNQMYIQRTTIGDFSAERYWSSSMYDGSSAWYQDFFNGNQNIDPRLHPGYVRPVRSF